METSTNLQHKIASADKLHSVVRTMKAVAASSINEYEQSVIALADYTKNIELGLSVCVRNIDIYRFKKNNHANKTSPCVVVFGSDQGLVGQFNDIIVDFMLNTLVTNTFSAPPLVWSVGERVSERLKDAGLSMQENFNVPSSIGTIAPLIGQIILDLEGNHPFSASTEVHLFYNRPTNNAGFTQVTQQLLPLDQNWSSELAKKPWPSQNLPELLGDKTDTLRALIREYLFVSLFRACAESLSSENASRLAAMQRADKNIEELLEELNQHYHRLRQATIDTEMFDVITGSRSEETQVSSYSS